MEMSVVNIVRVIHRGVKNFFYNSEEGQPSNQIFCVFLAQKLNTCDGNSYLTIVFFNFNEYSRQYII